MGGYIRGVIHRAKKEWANTSAYKLKTLKDATGRTLGEELVHEAKIVGNVGLRASSGDLKALGELFTPNIGPENPLDFEIRKNIEKGLKYAVQFLVTIIMSSQVMDRILEAHTGWNEGMVTAGVLTAVSMVVEQVRNLIKVKGPYGIAKYL